MELIAPSPQTKPRGRLQPERQGGAAFEVFCTQGRTPLANWRVAGPRGALKKTYVKAVRGYVYVLAGTGATRLCLPGESHRTCLLSQRYFVLQVLVPSGSAFSFELGVASETGERRRLFFSTAFNEAKVTTLHCQLPLGPHLPRDQWMNLCVDVTALASRGFPGWKHRCVEGVVLSPAVHIRKAFTLRSPPLDALPVNAAAADGAALRAAMCEPIPRGLCFPPGLKSCSVMLDATCLSRSNAEQQPDGVAAEADGLDGENASGLAGAYRGGGSFSARAAGSHGLSAHLAFGSRWPQGPPSVTAEGGSRARLPTSFGSPPRGVAMTASFSSPPAGITLAQRSPLRANVENQQQHNHNHNHQQQQQQHDGFGSADADGFSVVVSVDADAGIGPARGGSFSARAGSLSGFGPFGSRWQTQGADSAAAAAAASSSRSSRGRLPTSFGSPPRERLPTSFGSPSSQQANPSPPQPSASPPQPSASSPGRQRPLPPRRILPEDAPLKVQAEASRQSRGTRVAWRPRRLPSLSSDDDSALTAAPAGSTSPATSTPAAATSPAAIAPAAPMSPATTAPAIHPPAYDASAYQPPSQQPESSSAPELAPALAPAPAPALAPAPRDADGTDVELMYDPVLQAYFDPRTNRFFTAVT